jgi:hypothetical protein
MNKLFSILFISIATLAIAQPGKGKDPKMAPVTAAGYYLTLKGDTVRGEVQTNPDGGEAALYQGFSFKAPGATKVTPMSPKKAKGYGFKNKHFVLVPYDSQTEVYVEVLASGRLKFYEYRYDEVINKQPVISSAYYIQDTQADEKEKELKELKGISLKFYKKDLKPYMKDQPMTWNDLDKFNFNKEAVVKAIKEFNKYYETTESSD